MRKGLCRPFHLEKEPLMNVRLCAVTKLNGGWAMKIIGKLSTMACAIGAAVLICAAVPPVRRRLRSPAAPWTPSPSPST